MILTPALYLSRIVVEFAIPHSGVLGFLSGAIIGGSMAGWLRQTRLAPGWTTILLLPYVLCPYQAPELALSTGVLFAAVWLTSILKPRWQIDVIVFIVAMLVFGLTAAPDIQPADAGEFQLVIAEWGVAHPPGYPLYTLLGGILTRLIPIGDMAARVNLYSSIVGALTLALLARAVRLETNSGWAGVAAAGILGTAVSFWTTSTQASIRPMTALFTVLMLDAVLDYRRGIRTHTEGPNRALVRFGLFAGLGVTHHASLLFPGVVLALAAVAVRPGLLRDFRVWPKPILAALSGVLPWLYLLARGAAHAQLAPQNLATLSGLRQHVLATGFAGDMFYYRLLPDIMGRLRLMAQVLAFQWSDVVLALAGIALAILLWRDRWIAFTLGASFAVHTLVAATYRAPQTVEYMIPAYVFVAAAVGWTSGAFRRIWPKTATHAIFTAAIALGIAWSAWPSWVTLRAYQWRDDTAGNARELLANAPAGSIILANWHHVTPLWYAQTVEHIGDDIEVRYVAPSGAEPFIETWTRLLSTLSDTSTVVTCSYYPESFRHAELTFSAQNTCWKVGANPVPEREPASTFGDYALYEPALPQTARSGERVTVYLEWLVPEPLAYGETTTFVHLVDDEGFVVAQHDGTILAAGNDLPGVVTQRHSLALPRTLRPGSYQLMAGAYLSLPGGAESLVTEHGDERVLVGHITVLPSRLPPVTEHAQHATFGESLTLVGTDYDLSVPGRARLYLHWQIDTAGETWAITVLGQENQLAQGAFTSNDEGFVTTAYDIPDFEAVRGIQVMLSRDGEDLPAGVAWRLPSSSTLSLVAASWSDRYIMIGDSVIIGHQMHSDGSIQLELTTRSLTALTQDISVQIAYGQNQYNGTPVAGTIPTLKWGWGSTIRDAISLPLTEDSDNPDSITLILYDAFTSETWPVFDPILGQRGPALSITP